VAPAPSVPVGLASPAVQRLIAEVRRKLGPGMADVLTAQERLAGSLVENGRAQSELEARIYTAQHHLDQLDAELARLNADIDKTDGRIKENQAQVAAIARALYMEPGSLLMQVAEAGGPREAVTATGDLLSAAGRAEVLQRSLEADRTRLQAERAKQQSARDEEARALSEQSGALGELRTLLAQQQDTTEKLSAVLSRTQTLLANAGGEATGLGTAVADQIRFDVQALVAEAMREAWSQASVWARINHAAAPAQPSPPAGSGATAAAVPVDSHGSAFAWPEQHASITQGFGPSELWFEPSFGGYPHFHTGLDLVSSDTRIFAGSGGVVTAVGHGSSGYGNYVVIAHPGGYSSLYGHLSSALVSQGDTVAQGQQIGVEGSTGMSTGPHLHFEVRLNGEPVDPSPLLPSRGNSG
jgi:murein DD-endopeptidase MepM/ murein hydrolase activator NlpD